MGLFDFFRKNTKPTPQATSKTSNSSKPDYDTLKIDINVSPPAFDRDAWEQARKNTVLTKINNSIPSKNGLKPNEIYFLSNAYKFTTTQTEFNDYWYYTAGISSPRELLNRLENMGFITPAGVEKRISTLKVAELKELLKQLNLPISGKKEILIDRLWSNASQDFLEAHVTERNYSITDMGFQELNDNAYVMDLGFSPHFGFDMWEMNLVLKDNPLLTYHDIIWQKFNKELADAIKEKEKGDYYTYTSTLNRIAYYLVKNESFYEAFQYCAESSFYEITVSAVEMYRRDIDYNKEFGGNIIEFRYRCPISKHLFNKIKEGLGISNEEMYFELLEVFSKLKIPYHTALNFIPTDIIACEDVAAIIMFQLEDNEESLDGICNRIEAQLKNCQLKVWRFSNS